jgi:hypothetical protein
MRFWKWVFLAALLAARVQASGLTFALDPTVEVAQPTTFAVDAVFSGTLTDTDAANNCFDNSADCLYLNFVSFSFDQPTGTSHLSGDVDDFYLNVPGILFDEFNVYTGPIFGIQIAPNTPIGVYTGTVSILGGYDDSSASGLLARASWTVVVAPEPADFGLAFTGLAAVLLLKRRVSA